MDDSNVVDVAVVVGVRVALSAGIKVAVDVIIKVDVLLASVAPPPHATNPHITPKAPNVKILANNFIFVICVPTATRVAIQILAYGQCLTPIPAPKQAVGYGC